MKFFKNHQKILLLLLAALGLRLVLSFTGTLQLDQGTFIAWGNSLATEGFKNFYNGWSDYLPGYPFILWALAKIDLWGIIPQSFLYKLPAIFADIATGALIYAILRKTKDLKWSLIGAGLYVFNPAIISNSTLWGQVDSFTALTSLLSIYLLPEKLILSAAVLAFGTVIKPQAAFILPVVLFVFLKNKKGVWDYVKYGITGLIVFVLAFVPYWNKGNLLEFIWERLSLSLNQYPYTSVNAFNLWGLFGMWKNDTIYFQAAGYLIVLATSFLLAKKLWKVKNAQYILLAYIFGASFMLFTRMHERHLLPVFAPLTIIAIENPLFLVTLVGLSLSYMANLYYAFVWITDDFKEVFSDFMIKMMEALNVSFVAYLFLVAWKGFASTWTKMFAFTGKVLRNKFTKKVDYKLPKLKLTPQKSKRILVGILAFAFFTRVFNLASPQEMYFDEVYHAYTAKIILSPEAEKAWQWWDSPPEGFAYEWTHPPLAKLGMALGMLVFGQNSFGWRIPAALLGTGAVFLIYLLAKEIFKDEGVGLLSAAAYSLEGLALVMSRIGMNDSYILFFTLLGLYLYIKDRNFLSALSFGFAIASKWSAIWAVPIYGVIFLVYKKKLNWSYVWFFTLPFVVYLGSYFHMFLTNHGLDIWWGMQQQMWWYHTSLVADHPYTSQWWSWPFLIRPIYLYTSEEVGGVVARIYAFGNPFLFWSGVVAVFTALLYSYLEQNKKLALVAFAYLIFFVPWALSPRIMFLYHYLPSIPFMAIALGYMLRRHPKIMPYFFMTALLFFVYFFPHFIGMKVPLWLDQSYYWVSSWR